MKTKLFSLAFIYVSCSFSQGVSWINSVPCTNTEQVKAISTSKTNSDFFMCGDFLSTAAFGTYSLSSVGGSSDVFLARYDQNGNALWAAQGGGSGSDFGNGVAVDASGKAYITGSFYSSPINFGSTSLTPKGYTDLFIAKYGSAGNLIWAKSFGGTIYDVGSAIVCDNNSNIYITGFFSSSDLDFGGTILSSSGQHDMFIVKLDSSGTVQWAKNVGGTNFEYGTSLAIDNGGNILVSGYYMSNSITFGTTTLTNAGATNMFVTKYDPTGTVLWAKTFGGIGTDMANSISTDANGNCFVTGTFSSPSINFSGNVLNNSSAGSNDGFLAKLDVNGNASWAKAASGTGGESCYSISASATGDVFIGGSSDSKPLSIGNTTLMPDSSTAAYVAKFDQNGQVQCASYFNTNDGSPTIVADDKAGGAFISGVFYSWPFVVGTYTLSAPVQYLENIYVARYSCQNSASLRNEIESTIILTPNPCTESVLVTGVTSSSDIRIFDMMGRYETIQLQKNKIDLRAKPAGVYLIEVDTPSGKVTGKIIKLE